MKFIPFILIFFSWTSNSLTIASYNTWNHNRKDIDTVRMENIKTVLGSLNSDIIFLQEHKKGTECLLGLEGVFTPAMQNERGKFGQFVYFGDSKILDYERIKLSGIRAAQVITLNTKIGEVVFVNCHLDGDRRVRRQLKKIVEYLSGYSLPCVILGDFNIQHVDDLKVLIDAGYEKSDVPAEGRIDFCYAKGLKVEETVLNYSKKYSDHPLIVITLRKE